MKKLILFLLLPLWAMAQTSTTKEQEFDYGIKNNSAQTITTPPYLTTTGMDGTQGKIPSALIEKTDNKQNSLAVDGTGTKYPTVDAVNTGLVLKALDSNVVHKTGNETVAGNKTLSGTTTLNETIIREGYRLIFPRGVMYQSSVGTDALTGNRTVSFPDASGSVALISQTVTNGVITSSPSQDAVYDFVTANAASYIQNQNAAPQSANMWISGSIKAGAATFASTVTASTFIGSLSGNASSASNATAFGGFPYGGVYSSGALYYSTLFNSTTNEFQLADQSTTRTFLGLGSNAYTSTAYLPLTGGTLSGSLTLTSISTAPTAAPGTTGNQIATLDYVLANATAAYSGTYTPTYTATENISSITHQHAKYTVVGKIVTIDIIANVFLTEMTNASLLRFTLPVSLPIKSGEKGVFSGNIVGVTGPLVSPATSLNSYASSVGIAFRAPTGSNTMVTLSGILRYEIN